MTTVTETPSPYLALIDRAKDGLPGAALSWVRDLRAQGRERFAADGLPTVKKEAWKYTNLRALEKIAFDPAGDGAAAHFDVLPTIRAAGETGPRLVFVDGRLRADLSSLDGLPAGVTLAGLAAGLSADDDLLADHLGKLAPLDQAPLAALNTAFLADGAVLRVGRGVTVEPVIELVFVTLGDEARPTAFNPRTLIVVETNAKATVVEHHVGLGTGTTLANHVTEVFVADGATLGHYKAQREAMGAYHIATTAARVGRDASYINFILTTGAKLSRNEVWTELAGTGATCHVSGGYLVRGDQHCDTTTVIDHAAPHGTSREVYKGAIDGRARAVFQGKIIVRPGAQKTDGHQLNRALLLSDAAEIDAKPELEIYADDVKCSHGATAGELDDTALFYLRARGIDRDTARALLTAAFVAEAIDEIPDEPVRTAFQTVVDGWLAGA